MPKFSKDSFSKLSTCHPDLQVLFFEVIRTFDCTILEGYRNKEDQDKAYEAGNTKLIYPNGKHNRQPSFALDATPFPLDWNNTKRFYHFAGYVLGIASKLKDDGKMTHAIKWGGDWNGNHNLDDQSFNDLVHFELII